MGQNTEIKEAGDKGSKTTVGESTCGLAGGGLPAWRMRRRVMQGVAQSCQKNEPRRTCISLPRTFNVNIIV
jgi:hypothetical protein